MNREKAIYWLNIILSLFIVGVGLREFDYNHHYLTGLFLVIGGAYVFAETELKNKPNNNNLI